MIEKKFKDLVAKFFSGEIGVAELEWMAGDLHSRRERRDLFVEAIEDFLESDAGPGRRASDQRLRELIVKDLSQIEVRGLELAMPRKSSPSFASDRTESDEEVFSDDSVSKEDTVRRREVRFEKPEVAEKDSSFVMPAIGIAIIVLTFVFMVKFSSVKRDKIEAEEAAIKEGSEQLSDAAAFRQASEFISENYKNLAAEEEENANEESATPLENQNSPVSLVELIGEKVGVDGVEMVPSTRDKPLVILNEQ